MPLTLSREMLRERAKICEHAERFEDMLKDMSAIVKLGTALDNEERNLLSVAFKNVVGEFIQLKNGAPYFTLIFT